MSITSLPVLDLSLAQNPDTAEQFRTQLREATHEVGFFYLVGHGIPDELQRRLLDVAREFFALPTAEKLAIENVRSPHFRGYTRLGGELTEGKQDWREQIDIGAEQPRPSAPTPHRPGRFCRAPTSGQTPFPNFATSSPSGTTHSPRSH